jgi:DivIVA domain-containing protein
MRRNGAGHLYRSRRRISPAEVLQRRFPITRWGRRGVDEREVHRFLREVADELDATRSELRQAVDENTRLKHALRDWQATHSGQVTQSGYALQAGQTWQPAQAGWDERAAQGAARPYPSVESGWAAA